MTAILRSLRQLLPVLKLSGWSVAALVLLGLLAAVMEGFSISLIIPLLSTDAALPASGPTRWLASLFEPVPAGQRVPVIAGCILAGVVLKNLITYGYTVYFHWLNTGISHRLRSGILAQLLRLSQEYHDGEDSGTILNILGRETWSVTNALTVLADMVINLCMVVIFGVLMLAISWKLTLVCGVFFLGVSTVTWATTRRVRHAGESAVSANQAFAHRMLEILNGLRVVRAFGNEAHEQRRFDEASQGVRRTFFRMERISSLVHPLSEILAAVLLAGMMITAMDTPGKLPAMAVFLVLLYRLQNRVKSLDGQRATLSGLSGSFEAVRSLLDLKGKPTLASGTARPASLGPEIRFENVSLAYGKSADPALKDINLVIRIGETTALAGASGAGKSSLINLICRLYDPTQGRIVVGGCDLREIDLAWWRSQIALVSQDVYLFNASVAENIAYGRLGASREEIRAAAVRAHALDFIEALPSGFETILGDRGLRLSGGQRQRIALARALIRDPQILILDEATNALDLESEHLVQDALETFARGRTVIVIAHRINTIETASKVLVMDSGRIIEEGTAKELAAAGGGFSRLCALHHQRRSNEEVDGSAL